MQARQQPIACEGPKPVPSMPCNACLSRAHLAAVALHHARHTPLALFVHTCREVQQSSLANLDSTRGAVWPHWRRRQLAQLGANAQPAAPPAHARMYMLLPSVLSGSNRMARHGASWACTCCCLSKQGVN
eukprot:364754-Chlamydomonas_euryale.AAC.5